MRWVKSGLAGFVGGLVMFIIMYIGIHVTGVAPFELPPSQALLRSWGIPEKPLGLIMHFGYAIFWSIVLVAVLKDRVTIWAGLGLSVLLWLGMMLGHSPLIGWGVFGVNGTSESLEAGLRLSSVPKFIGMTLLLHVVYGLIIGWLNPLMVDFSGQSRV